MKLMNEKNEDHFFSKKIIKEWYFKKRLILIDIFIVIGLIQYFIFNGSFNEMIKWILNLLNY